MSRDKKLRLNVTGVTEAARPYLITKTPSLLSGPILVATADNDHVAVWTNELKLWLDRGNQKKVKVTAYDELPESEQLSQIPSVRRYRNLGVLARLLRNEPGIYVAPIRGFMERLPDPDRFREMTLRLAVGDSVSQSKVLHDLEEIGYEPDSMAQSPGTFARRGELVEFFSPDSDKPTRLSFAGNTLEKITRFDIETKKDVETLKEAMATPLNLLTGRGRLANFVGDPTQWSFINDDPAELLHEIDPLGQNNDVAWAQINKVLNKTRQVSFYSFMEDESAESHNFSFSVPPLFRGHIPSLREEVKGFAKKNFQILLLTGDADKIKAALNTKSKNVHVEQIAGELRENLAGFRDDAGKLLVLTDREVFGPESVQPPRIHRAKRFDQAFVAELEPGHYVVHVDHGIGRFLGMVRNILSGVEKEYFVMQYAQGDRLYIPVDTAEKISKYIGSANPSIHRLSETSWLAIKSELKESTEKIAKELIKLYAERQVRPGVQFKPEQDIEKEFAKTFPYEPTPDQLKAVEEIHLDMQRAKPMDRLLVGDVGFGKTEVAMRAAFKAAVNGKQCAVLAPTTILADQHYKNFTKRMDKFPFSVGVLSRFQSPKEQRETIAKMKAGTVDIVIGTHRLLSKDVRFKDLGLIVVDEEQRFGVKHKEQLKEMRSNVHVLSLSATPIPRTLQFSLSGIRDISTIETPPAGRFPIETKVAVFDDKEVKRAIEFEIERGGQVYVLHNRIESIGTFAQKIASLVPKARVRVGHGQLHETELAKVMDDFYDKKYDVLVASTIIENGLDIPSVNTIIVDKATNFGLSQLYQLRGRIGRGNKRAYAYLYYNRQDLKGPARSRLLALLEATELGSGFQIALRDLELRGAGNLLGAEQSGQIKSVGLNMYLRLLHRAVQEVKTGKKEAPILDVTVDIPLAAYFPTNYVSDERERLSLYQYLGSVTDPTKLEEEKRDLVHHHGDLPTQAANFFRLLGWKLIAAKARVLSITTGGIQGTDIASGTVSFEFVDEPPFGKVNAVLTTVHPGWQLKDNTLQIQIGELGPDWTDKIEQALEVLARPSKEESKEKKTESDA